MSTHELTCDKCVHARIINQEVGATEQWQCRLNPPIPIYVQFRIMPAVFSSKLSMSPGDPTTRGFMAQLAKLDWAHVVIHPACPACSHFVAKEVN